jgi:2-C-methyl-D-erythritol 4-phosphate cytidylyltransferase
MIFAAVIVASGDSRRMGFDKLTAPLAGVPVLHRTVAAFRACDFVEYLVVVTPAERFADAGLTEGGRPPLVRVDGGPNRQASVAQGVAAVPTDTLYIAVHDGARPLVTTEIISECFAKAREYGAACAARPVNETLKRADAQGFTRLSVERDNLWITETPQIFRARVLRRACEEAAERHAAVTDEVSAVELLGISSYLVQSRTPNPKITHPWDLEFAAQLVP